MTGAAVANVAPATSVMMSATPSVRAKNTLAIFRRANARRQLPTNIDCRALATADASMARRRRCELCQHTPQSATPRQRRRDAHTSA